MDQLVDHFLTPGTAVLALVAVIITFFVRRVVETAFPSLAKKADENAPEKTYETTVARWYQQVLLYLVPVVAGSLLGLANITYLFNPEVFAEWDDRVVYGAAIGWLSSFVYKVVRQVLKKKTGLDIQPTADSLPGAETDVQEKPGQ